MDKNDIISCGFTEYSENNFIGYNMMIKFYPKTNFTSIIIQDPSKSKIYETYSEDRLFNGTITDIDWFKSLILHLL